MIAVIQVAGQQYTVSKDQVLHVPHLNANAGDTIELDLLLTDDGDNLKAGTEVSGKAKAEILEHVLGEKIIAYKQKRRKGFHKKKGHRTLYTKIKITSLG
ncbi:MAG: 50S ribosomal protein L21 [Chitinophagaceae bacterium]|nr:50S ribosomal protein L21 [Chitinophagaceae bacterium]